MKTLVTLLPCLLLSLLACDSRDAMQPPEPVTGCVLDTPERAFVCMKQALANQKTGDYERSISESFVFSPTLEDSLDVAFTGSPVYAGWNKDVEMQTLNLLLDDTSFTHVDWGTPARLIDKNTFVRWSVSYALKTVTVAAPTDTVVYKATAYFDVRNEGGNWRVTFWDEISNTPGYSSWGYLRGVNRLRLGT
jgi:hypothetical protein